MTTASKRLLHGTAALVLTAFTLYGCGDFLDDASAPQGVLNEETLANRTGVEGTLIATYRALDWNNGVGGAWGNAASDWVWGSVPSDDAYKGSEATDQPPIDDVEQFQWGTPDSESYLNDKWRGVYEGVVRANATLRLLAKVVADNPGEFSAAEVSNIRGQALFLRAHFHFEAYRMWGSVPYYREDDTDFRKANVAPDVVLTNIITDLDAAIAALPTSQGQKGRVHQWTAKAYKGRVQVYQGQYAAALTTLRDVRTNGPFALETSFDRVWTGYADLENGPETILAYQASVNDGEPNGNNANYGERLNFPHSGSYYGCCGFHQPSQDLVNFFRVNAAGLPLALTDPNWNVSNANFVGGNMLPVDPRLDWTVGRDGVPFKDAGNHASTWIRAPAYGGPYSPKKNIHEISSGSESTVGWVPTQLNGVNIHIFRYADMLLLLAEAEVEAGVLANAQTIVNQIRARAGVRVQGTGRSGGAPSRANLAVPLGDASVTWATYQIGLYPAFASQAEARTAVRYERRLELAMEGQRFFDLRRWGTAEAVLNAHINGGALAGNSPGERTRRSQLGNSQTFAARHRWFPIPAIQIQLSRVDGTPRLTQNTGW